MAFLFKKNKHHQQQGAGHAPQHGNQDGRGATPPSGPSSSSSANGTFEQRSVEVRNSPPTQTQMYMDRGDPRQHQQPQHMQQGPRQIQGPSAQPQQPRPAVAANINPDLYPWSRKPMSISSSAGSPFPRYGHSANSNAGKEGEVYILGGLLRSESVRGDLWLLEGGGPNLAVYPVNTTAEGPGPRVGHASLLVGNAFIVFGGDTKMSEHDRLDDTLYLLNTSSRQWSRAQPNGDKPSGRYGHTLNILGSKLYVFGGQAEGSFFNDLMAFDLNTLQSNASRWEMLVPNADGSPDIPAKRTNHTVVSFGDKLYLFGGTNGLIWFNDVWAFDPRANSWAQLDCIGYIPSPREGHSAALVGDTMYVFGGRSNDGTDLGDLAAFRIPSRRWYTFQNMGPSPSPRSGHSMTTYGSRVVVLGGEPSVQTNNPEELTYVYILDTAKIRYPNDQQLQDRDRATGPTGTAVRRPSGAERPSNIGGPGGPGGPPTLRKVSSAGPGRESLMMGPGAQPPNGIAVSSGPGPAGPAGPGGPGGPGSRLPRASIAQAPGGPPPQQQAPNPRGPVGPPQVNGRSKTPTRSEQRPSVDTGRGQPAPIKEGSSSPPTANDRQMNMAPNGNRGPPGPQQSQPQPVAAVAASARPVSPPERSRSRQNQTSIDSIAAPIQQTLQNQKTLPNGQVPNGPQSPVRQESIESRASMDPPMETVAYKEVENLRQKNAWYASELALARKQGYSLQNSRASDSFEDRAAEDVHESDRPLLEALVVMKTELRKVQGSVDEQAVLAAKRIAEVERQRDDAVSEAVYMKTKLAALGGVTGNMSPIDVSNMEADRASGMERKLAASLALQTDLQAKVRALTSEVEAERKARQLADDLAAAAQSRVSELDDFRNRTSELESLRAELIDAKKILRDEELTRAQAVTQAKMLGVDKEELAAKVEQYKESQADYVSSIESLRSALVATQQKTELLEQQLEDDRTIRESQDRKLARLKSEYEERSADLDAANRRLRDVEELAEKHAIEAKSARDAMMAGLEKAAGRDVSNITGSAAEERVAILQDQVQSSKDMLAKHKEQADEAGERLAHAMQRVAGLELMQAQASKEAINLQRRMADLLDEGRRLKQENSDLTSKLAERQLDVDTVNSKHNALRDLLVERGINPDIKREIRSRNGLGSPGSGSATPDQMHRLRELESQLEASIRAHNETKNLADLQAQEAEKVFSLKLEELESNYQSVVKYVKGTEKMLNRMKDELVKTKAQNAKLITELEEARSSPRSEGVSLNESSWEAERENLAAEISSLQAKLSESSSTMERRLLEVQKEVNGLRIERDTAKQQSTTVKLQLMEVSSQLEKLENENAMLETRANEAEKKVSTLLDRLETSVDAYRESVRFERRNDNHGAEYSERNSLYNGAEYRNSLALDSFASELDELKASWHARSSAYRFSPTLDFGDDMKTPTSTNGGELSASLAEWRKRLNDEEEEARKRSSSRTSDLTVEQRPTGIPDTTPKTNGSGAPQITMNSNGMF
ncbi:Negative regulator of mitotic exit [Orbilia oligospora]|uniref:Negative regulator of mitotic exit n=1 Tax=Orbilia oligospora TaxID=2813651 RepID=A0A7C8UJG3_ORBOL|nr:Negative regulator of mitotic exit [Orbilia oligospora]